jgi:predicted dienelactone hydrolase
MTIIDLLLIAALAVFLVAWWVRRTPRRPQILLGSALAALALGLADVVDDRWQGGIGAVVALVLLAVLLVNRLRKAPSRTGIPFVSGPVFTLLGAVAVLALVQFPVSPLPKPSGPYPVGVRAFEVADASRPGVFGAKPGEPRRLLVRVWYPAASVAGLKPRPYFDARETKSTARTLGGFVGFPPFFTYVRHVRTHSYEDAPLRAGTARFPVVFYSHGYTSFLSQNTVLMEDLASHGYVVFSVQHTYDSAATAFLDGTVAPFDPKIAAAAREKPDPAQEKAQFQALAGATPDARLDGYLKLREIAQAGNARLLQSGEVWAADRIFLHDQLQKGAVPQPIREIAAAGDLDRVGEMGMSFGGATTGTVCVIDRRCAAGINLDGGDFPFQAFDTDMPVPFLMFHSDLANFHKALHAPANTPKRSFNEFSYESFARAGTHPDLYRVSLKGAQHLGISDFSLFMRRPVRDALLGTTPSTVMVGAQNAFVRGFFDRYLRGQANGFPQPQLAAYAGWVTPVANAEVRPWWAAKSEGDRAAIEARIARAKAGAP